MDKVESECTTVAARKVADAKAKAMSGVAKTLKIGEL